MSDNRAFSSAFQILTTVYTYHLSFLVGNSPTFDVFDRQVSSLDIVIGTCRIMR